MVYFSSNQRAKTNVFQHKKALRLLSCNVCGLRDHEKLNKIVSHYLYPHNVADRPDVFTFQETHSSPDVIPVWTTKVKGTVLMSHGDGQSKGVMLGFAPHLQCNIQSSYVDENGRFIVADVRLNDDPLTIVAVYLEPTLSN